MNLKISYINSLCVSHDAISESIKNEVLWLIGTKIYDVKLYCYKCDFDSLPFNKVNDLAEVAFDQHFQVSDLVVFHFGVFYPLFNLIHIAPTGAKRLVVFHNITPKQFVSAANHQTIDNSFQQLTNIVFADHVACDSQTNLDVLRTAGIHTPSSILPLAVHCENSIPKCKPSAVDGMIRLAFVGRFVRSKGPNELLEALQKVAQRNQSVLLKLVMVGNLSFSDSVLLEEIRNTVELIHRSYGGRVNISIHGNATEETKLNILQDADIFVLPTYHEGFCVPILEALASGCKVIAYDNSNTPAISGGLARLTPTGDVDALSAAIGDAIAEISSPSWRKEGPYSYTEYAQKAWEYVQQYSPKYTKQRFLNFIKQFAMSQPQNREHNA